MCHSGTESNVSIPHPCPGAGAQDPKEVLCSLGCRSTVFFRSLGSWQDKDKESSLPPALGLLMPGPAVPCTASRASQNLYLLIGLLQPSAHVMDRTGVMKKLGLLEVSPSQNMARDQYHLGAC